MSRSRRHNAATKTRAAIDKVSKSQRARHADRTAMDAIRDVLSGTEWSMDTLDTIADIVRGTGRAVTDTPMPARDARIKCTDDLGNVHYIYMAGRDWYCTTASRMPCAFSYAGVSHRKEQEFAFDLNDCKSADEVLATVKRYSSHRVELV